MSRYTRPNLRNAAVVTIDAQNDFSLPGASAEIPGTSEVLPRMKRILDVARSQGVPIVHVVRFYQPDGSNVDLCRKELIESGAAIVLPGTSGAELADELKPPHGATLQPQTLLAGELQPIGEREWAIYKPRWGAFYQTALESFLRSLQLDTLIFIGCNFPNCPRTSIYEASERDFKIVMVRDAISGTYERGIEELRNIGVAVCDTDALLEELENIRGEVIWDDEP